MDVVLLRPQHPGTLVARWPLASLPTPHGRRHLRDHLRDAVVVLCRGDGAADAYPSSHRLYSRSGGHVERLAKVYRVDPVRRGLLLGQRFVWHRCGKVDIEWLDRFGLAPDLVECYGREGFGKIG